MEKLPILLSNEYKNIFTRKKIKKLFMIIPYNSTAFTLKQHLKHDLNKSEMLLVDQIFSSVYSETLNMFNTMGEFEFKKLSTHPALSKDYQLSLGNNHFDYRYRKRTENSIVSEYGGERRRIKDYKLLPEVDIRKTENALPANIVHTLDAAFLREIVQLCAAKHITVYTVHDEFIVNIKDYLIFLEIVVEIYNKLYFDINKKKMDFESFFIVL